MLGLGFTAAVAGPLVLAGRAEAGYTDPRSVRVQRLPGGFADPIGTWIAGDIPHIYPLPDRRNLWLLNDSFISTDASDNIDTTALVRNVAISQDRHRFSVLNASRSFQHDGETLLDRWWWFHGGIIDGDKLLVITTEMIRNAPVSWEINFEPNSTWITTIDWRTNQIVDMVPAPNAGVLPVYGFSIASDTEWTYLFGNNHLYGRNTNRNWVARVALGQLHDQPEYWSTDRWTGDATRATSILTHGDYACRLNVIRHGARWLATAKDEEFNGTDLLIFESPGPVGPWKIIRRLPVPTKTGDDRTCTYDAMAHSLDPQTLLLWWSNNAYTEALFRSDPSIYRPTFNRITLG